MKRRLNFRLGIRNSTVIMLMLVLGFALLNSMSAQAQDRNKRQKESLLINRKWTIVDVKRNKLTKLKKMDGFRMEEGNELSFGIDHKFGYKNNDYEYRSGKWVLDGKRILLVYDARDATNRLENMHFKVIKLSKTELYVKRMDKPKGKLVFK